MLGLDTEPLVDAAAAQPAPPPPPPPQDLAGVSPHADLRFSF